MTDVEKRPSRAPVPSGWEYAPAPEARDIVHIDERYGLYVGGEWLDAKEHYTTISPSSEEPLAEIAQAGPEEVRAAVAVAREAAEGEHRAARRRGVRVLRQRGCAGAPSGKEAQAAQDRRPRHGAPSSTSAALQPPKPSEVLRLIRGRAGRAEPRTWSSAQAGSGSSR